MMILIKRLGMLVLVAAGLLPGARLFAQNGTALQVTEVSLGKLLKMPDPGARLASSDNRHFAYIAGIGGNTVVVLDGKQGPQYDSIVKHTLSFGPDSQQLVYAAKRNGALYLVLNQNEQVLMGELTPPAFSRNPLISPDGHHVASILKRDNKVVAVRDGVAGKAYDRIVYAAFSADSQRFIYTAGNGDESFVVVDEVEGKHYRDIGLPQFSSDSKLVVYSATTEGGSMAVVNEQAGKLYPMLDGIAISSDSKHLAYLGTNAEKLTMAIVDGIEGRPYEGITSAVRISRDVFHVAYVATHTGQSSFLVRDGIEQKEYPIIFDVSFSPNGESMAYRARVVSGDMVVRDGVEGERFKTVEHQSITFSPDSKRFAYKVISGSNEFIVLDNVRGKKYKGVGYPAFSADSKHLAYVAADAKGWRIVMDGRTSGAYESILNRETLRFDHSGAISFIAIRKGEAFRVRVDS